MANGSIVTGQTDWKHAGKFIPEEMRQQRGRADQSGTNPTMTHYISIINSSPASDPNTKANRYVWKSCFPLAALTTNDGAIFLVAFMKA